MGPQLQMKIRLVRETLNDSWSGPCAVDARVSYAVCDLATTTVADDSETHVACGALFFQSRDLMEISIDVPCCADEDSFASYDNLAETVPETKNISCAAFQAYLMDLVKIFCDPLIVEYSEKASSFVADQLGFPMSSVRFTILMISIFTWFSCSSRMISS